MKAFNKIKELGEYLVRVGATKVALSTNYLDDDGKKEYIDFMYNEKSYTYIVEENIFSLRSNDNCAKDEIEEVAALISIYVGKRPVCFYVNNSLKDYREIPTIEWGSGGLSNRLTRIIRPKYGVDGNDFAMYSELYPGTPIYYIERAGLNRLNECIFGRKWPQDFDSILENCSEQDLYLIIYVLSSQPIDEMTGVWNDERTENLEMNNFYKKAVKSVKRFVDSDDGMNDRNRDFLKWWNKWSNYFTLEKMCEYIEAKEKGEDLSIFTSEQKETQKVKKYSHDRFYI